MIKMSKTKVMLKNIYKSFRRKNKVVDVLKGVNLEIEEGKFTVILAPSGEGKTTLLRIIAGLERPDRGQVIIDGKVMNDVPPKDRNLAMVFQNYAIYPFLNVYDNIAFPLKIAHVDKDEIKRRVEEVARMLQIDQLLDRKPMQLSGGQRQRVAIARALVKGTKLLLMDEPLSNLDAQLRTRARAELKELQNRLGITIVYVTHDQSEAMVLADNVAILHNGVVEDFGSPMRIYMRPATTWVASFIGNPPMNLVEGRVSNGKFLFGDYIVELPSEIIQNLELRDGEAVFGIRPEYVRIGKGDIKATVKLIEPLGSQTLFHVSVNGVDLKIMVFGNQLIELNKQITINLSSENAVIFDKATGKIAMRGDVSLFENKLSAQ